MTDQEQIFRRWLNDHRGIVIKVTRAYAWSLHDQEDLSQEILLQIWRSIPSFRSESSESTWVYRVALNTAMTWRRDLKKRHSEEIPEEVPCPKPLPDDCAADQEILEWLYAQMAAWPKLDRSLLLLYLDGVSYREMAEIIGISESNVGVKLNRLRKELSEQMRGSSHGF